jgi:hypothetical protein
MNRVHAVVSSAFLQWPQGACFGPTNYQAAPPACQSERNRGQSSTSVAMPGTSDSVKQAVSDRTTARQFARRAFDVDVNTSRGRR